jgi:hypothetical protein
MMQALTAEFFGFAEKFQPVLVHELFGSSEIRSRQSLVQGRELFKVES